MSYVMIASSDSDTTVVTDTNVLPATTSNTEVTAETTEPVEDINVQASMVIVEFIPKIYVLLLFFFGFFCFTLIIKIIHLFLSHAD